MDKRLSGEKCEHGVPVEENCFWYWCKVIMHPERKGDRDG